MDMDTIPKIPIAMTYNNNNHHLRLKSNHQYSELSMSARKEDNSNEDLILNTNEKDKNLHQEVKNCIDSMIENLERESYHCSNGVFNQVQISNNGKAEQQDSLMVDGKIVDDSVENLMQLPPLFHLPETTSMAPLEQGFVKLKDSTPILESILKAEAQVDTLICCNNGKLGAHRVILGLWSPLLREMFSEQNYEDVAVLILPDISVKTMNLLLYLAYNGSIKYTKEDEEEFLDALECLLFGADAQLFLTTTTYKSKPKLVPEVLLEQPPSSIASTSSTLPVSKNISPTSHSSSRQSRDTTSSDTDFEMTNTNSNCSISTKSRSHTDTGIKYDRRIYNKNDNYESEDDIVSCSSKNSERTSKSLRKSLRTSTSGYACKHCEKLFNDSSVKVRHEKCCSSLKVNFEELQKLSYCNICDKQFKSIIKANSCLMNHDCKRCLFCLQICKKDDLLTHIQIHHSLPSINEITNKKEYKQVKCKWCKKMVSVENNASIRGFVQHCSTVHFSQLQGQEVKKSENYVNSDVDVDADSDISDISIIKRKKRKYEIDDQDYENKYRKKKRKTTDKEVNSQPASGSIVNYITRKNNSASPIITSTNNNQRLHMEGNKIQVSIKSGISDLKIIEKMNELVRDSIKEKPVFTIYKNKCTVNTHNIPNISIVIPDARKDPLVQQYLNKIQNGGLSKLNHSQAHRDRDQNISINKISKSSLKIDHDHQQQENLDNYSFDQKMSISQQETQLLQLHSPTTINSSLSTFENETESIENTMIES